MEMIEEINLLAIMKLLSIGDFSFEKLSLLLILIFYQISIAVC